MEKLALAALIALLVVALVGLVKMSSIDLSLTGRVTSTNLVVYNWEQYIDPAIMEDFEKTFGIEIELVEFENMARLVDRLEASPWYPDVLIVDDHTLSDLKERGLLGSLNRSKLPNIEDVDARFLDLPHDQGNQFSVPYFWGTTGIAYNTRFVKENVDSWAVLWDPRYAGTAVILDSNSEVAGMVLQKLGYPANSEDPTHISQAVDELAKANVKVMPTLDMMAGLINREVLVAQAYNGDAFGTNLANPDIAYTLPREGGFFWVDNLAVSRRTAKAGAAHSFINFLLSPEVSGRNSESQKFASPIKREKLAAHMSPQILNNRIIYPDEEALAETENVRRISGTLHDIVLNNYRGRGAPGQLITGTSAAQRRVY